MLLRFALLVMLAVLPGHPDAQTPITRRFTAIEVSLDTGTGSLSGTLTLPDVAGPLPVILIIPGSGPTDRDGNSPLGLHTDMYKKLAEDLAARGIAALRYDKRGIRRSAEALTAEEDLRFDDGIRDAAGWIRWLQSDTRFSRVIVFGHSEGSLIGMVAAKDANASAFISAEGPGRPADDILREQLALQLPPDLLAESTRLLDSLVAGKTVSNPPPALTALFRPSVQPYLISWFAYDPAREIGNLRIPVLILQGTTDLQVSADEAKRLAAGLPEARLLLLDGMNHVLKQAPADTQKNILTYSDPVLPLKEGVVSAIASFIQEIK